MLDQQLGAGFPGAGFGKLNNTAKPANGGIPATKRGYAGIDEFLVKLIASPFAIFSCALILPPQPIARPLPAERHPPVRNCFCH